MTDPKFIKVGKALMDLADQSPLSTILMSILFPTFSKRMRVFIEAMTPLVEDEVFGTDEELLK